MLRKNHLITLLLLVTLLLSACQPYAPATKREVQPTNSEAIQLVGHLGGSAFTVALQGHYAYVGFSYELVVLDIADPAKPREVSRMALGAKDEVHWLSVSPDTRRVVVTGYDAMQHRVVLARFDSTTGQIALDTRFREAGKSEPGFFLDDKAWPHGGRAKGIAHGAVFSRP